jgi:hypothetical protein
MKCRTATMSRPTGRVRSTRPVSVGLLRIACGSRRSPSMTAVFASAASVRVHPYQRVVVHVGDARRRGDLRGDLVHVLLNGQAGADTDELPDARLPVRPTGVRPASPARSPRR